MTLAEDATVSGFDWRGIQLPKWPIPHRRTAVCQACTSNPTETDADQSQQPPKNAFNRHRRRHPAALTLDTDTPLITWQIPIHRPSPASTGAIWTATPSPEIVVGDHNGNFSCLMAT
ncbi:MAG: hypothetical protein IPK53_07475 [bacterium]|nr:hypothetical protein [bacterium]